MAPSQRGPRFEQKLLQNRFAKMLEILCFITWGVLTKFVDTKSPRVQDGPAPGVRSSMQRNTLKNIQNFYSSEPLDSDAGNLVCSIA